MERRGFTLIELLVVIAVIALLISILLPALGSARRSGTQSVSLSNLRSNAQVLYMYANENRDDWLNPFEQTTRCPASMTWVWVPGRYCNFGWRYSGTRGELYGMHWVAHMFYATDPGASRLRSNIAPGDTALASWFKSNAPAQGNIEWIFPSSYWYPPVFFQDVRRFVNNPRLGAVWIKRHKINDVVYPTQKVLLFEGKQYDHPRQPMWNEPDARPLVALVDASARAISIKTIIEDQASTPQASEPGKLPWPAGNFDYGDATMTGGDYEYGSQQGFFWTFGKPAYFWFTRNGIRGRDFARF